MQPLLQCPPTIPSSSSAIFFFIFLFQLDTCSQYHPKIITTNISFLNTSVIFHPLPPPPSSSFVHTTILTVPTKHSFPYLSYLAIFDWVKHSVCKQVLLALTVFQSLPASPKYGQGQQSQSLIFYLLESEIGKLQVVASDEDACNQSGKLCNQPPSSYPQLIIITFIA